VKLQGLNVGPVPLAKRKDHGIVELTIIEQLQERIIIIIDMLKAIAVYVQRRRTCKLIILNRKQ
jgi:hypothetical protein